MAKLYHIAASGPKAYAHYQETIEKPVQRSKVAQHLSQGEMKTLDDALKSQPIYAWGAKLGEENLRNWGNLASGDYILIYVQGKFTRLARVALKMRNYNLAKELWGTDNGYTWEYMYFLKDMQVIDYQLSSFNQDLGYHYNFIIYGFSEVPLRRYKDRFSNLEIFLQKRVLAKRPIRALILYEDYSREEVHDIFKPDTSFMLSRGIWGLRGIIPIPNRPGDFTFFVTFGRQQGKHIFDEGITEDGVLSWQSQPSQHLLNPQIQRLIKHDELKNSIYLFLRTRVGKKYTYLGKLKYLTHDKERERPVYFQWQILDWDIPDDVKEGMELELQAVSKEGREMPSTVRGMLRKTAPPPRRIRQGRETRRFQAYRVSDRSRDEVRNKELGEAGELLVVEYEKRLLKAGGRTDLADRVRHVSLIEGDGAGYDIEAFTLKGEVKYIEVKTTEGSIEMPFQMTSNEVGFSRQHKKHYYLYRVYDYDQSVNSARLYIIAGSVEDSFTLTPVRYRATRAYQK